MMPSVRDVTRETDAKSIDIVDLLEIVSHYFGSAHQTENETLAGRSPDYWILRMRHSPNGALKALELLDRTGEAAVADIARHIAELRNNPGRPSVGRRYVFTEIPLAHGLAVKDWFQFFPVPDEAPRSDNAWGRHPAVLEAAYLCPANAGIAMRRRVEALDEAELLLNALFKYGVQKQPGASIEWGFAEGSADQTSVPFNLVYGWPTMPSGDGIFTDISGYADFREVEPETYYRGMQLGTVDGAVVPAVATDFGAMIGAYRRLKERDRQRFLQSAYWFQYSDRARAISTTASYLALVQAIEALVEPQRSPKKCPTCNAAPGAVRGFHALVEQHACGIEKKWRDKIYSMRSRIVHSGRRLRGDSAILDMHPRSLGEMSDHRALSQIVRLILRNWLAARQE